MSQFPGHQPVPDGTPIPEGAQSGRGEPNDITVVLGAITADNASSTESASSTRRLTSEEQAAIGALPTASALLIMQPGPGVGARFLLDGDRTDAGRSERADIFLDDVTVSRKHAQFLREGQNFFVRDSGSLNGTYVNRERIESGQLRSGDEVQIGKYRMTFHAGPAHEQGTAEGAE